MRATMETEEIYTFAISSMPAGNFIAQWSEDDHISICTKNGIYIFEMVPTPLSSQPSIKFCRSFVYCPNNIPGEAIVAESSEWIWNLDKEELYPLLLEEKITPKLEDFSDIIPRITSVAWSPRNLVFSSKCLLAIITSTGAVLVAYVICNEWFPAYDLSCMRRERETQGITLSSKHGQSESNSVNIFKNRMKQLQASCMVWSEMLDKVAYLAVVYYNGDIVVYKIPQILDPLKEIPELEVAMETTLACNSKVTSLYWITISKQEFIIIIGYFDGQLHGLRIVIKEGILSALPKVKYYDIPDRITINNLSIHSQNDRGIRIFASKGSYLFLLRLTMTGELMNLQHIQVKGFSISGICTLNDNYALLVTENASMWLIDTRAAQLALTEVKNRLPCTRYIYSGLAHSRNRAFFLTTASPNTVYDHLIIKEPCKIMFFNFSGEQWTPLSILTQNKQKRLADLWDCFEMLRIKATKHREPATLFPKLTTEYDCLELHELRIAMWMSLIFETSCKKQSIRDFNNIDGEISEAQPLIFVYTACNYLERLARKSNLTEEEKTSINSLRMHLEIYLAGEDNDSSSLICKRASEAYKLTTSLSTTKLESCGSCGKVLDDFPWKIQKCPDGHILSRCAITLLQITGIRYKYCPVCRQIFHPCLDEEYGETRCLLCDVLAVHDDRMLDFKDIREKSLSKPRMSLPDPSAVENEIDPMQE